MDKIQEIKKLKDLLVDKAITQAEFEILKKEILIKTPLTPKIEKQQPIKKRTTVEETEPKFVKSKFEKVNKDILGSSKGNNQKVYLIILLVFIAFIVFNNISTNDNDTERVNSYNKESNYDNSSTISNEPNPSNSASKPNIISHLENNHFSLNGNGNVSFYMNRKRAGDRNVTGTISISGGRATLQGEISILNDYSFMVYNLKAISGYYDASINNGSTGVFHLQSNGNLNGKLSAGGQSKSVTFQVKL